MIINELLLLTDMGFGVFVLISFISLVFIIYFYLSDKVEKDIVDEDEDGVDDRDNYLDDILPKM